MDGLDDLKHTLPHLLCNKCVAPGKKTSPPVKEAHALLLTMIMVDVFIAHHDVVYVFLLLRLRVGVIKTQVAVSVVLGSHAKVNEHCLQVQSTAGGGVSSWAILIKCGTKSRPSDLKLAL